MRRKHCEVTNQSDIERILSSTNIGRMATNGPDGYPYVTPVNFVYYQGNIYFHSSPKGEKLDNLARDPRVCFEVDIPLAYLDAGLDPERRIGKLHQLYHCVIIQGEASFVPDGPLKTVALNALVTKHEGGSDHELVNEEMPSYKACAVIEIKPITISAKSDLAQNKTLEERLAVAQYLRNRNRTMDLETIAAMGFSAAEL